MNHISIEGMDGVGKTTICKMLEERLGYKRIEKPLHYLFDEEENGFSNYIRIRNIVNNNDNRDFTAWFYCLGCLYMYDKFATQNIITDRHFASIYAWSGSDNNQDIFDLIIKKIGYPKLTVILYAQYDTIVNRLQKRDIKDKDIKRAIKSEEIYARMISFCKEKDFPFIVIDTTNLTEEEIVDIIIKKIEE